MCIKPVSFPQYKLQFAIIGSISFIFKLFKEIQLDPIFEFDISFIKGWSFFQAAK